MVVPLGFGRANSDFVGHVFVMVAAPAVLSSSDSLIAAGRSGVELLAVRQTRGDILRSRRGTIPATVLNETTMGGGGDDGAFWSLCSLPPGQPSAPATG